MDKAAIPKSIRTTTASTTAFLVVPLHVMAHSGARIILSNSDEPLYFDYNATTPVDKVLNTNLLLIQFIYSIRQAVAKEMRPFLDDFFGNPSSSHAYGIRTKQVRLINCPYSKNRKYNA